MSKNRDIWMYGGALLIAAISSSNLFVGDTTLWVPLPFYQVILLWTIPSLVVLFVPGIYLLEMKFISKSPNFIKLVNLIVITFCILDALYLWGSWDNGYRYQGEFHTQIVVLENIIGFSIVVAISIWSLINKNKVAAYVANFILFGLLSWCAFPYLGEMP